MKKKSRRESPNSMHIKEFHKRYVLVPADKASNNIIVVCKKYYIDMIVNELMNASQPSTYYNVSDSNSEQLIRKHLYLRTIGYDIGCPNYIKAHMALGL